MGHTRPLSSYNVHVQDPAFHAAQYLRFNRYLPCASEVQVDGDAELNAQVGAKESIN